MEYFQKNLEGEVFQAGQNIYPCFVLNYFHINYYFLRFFCFPTWVEHNEFFFILCIYLKFYLHFSTVMLSGLTEEKTLISLN